MAPTLQISLVALGVVRTFPRVVAHSPAEYLGFDIPHLYDLQGWSHICMAIKHGQESRSITGRLIRCSIQHLKLELALPGSVFNHDYELVGCLATESWVKSLWSYLYHNHLQLEETTISLSLQREQDQYLIGKFLEVGYRHGDLKALSCCRMFLQVTTLADITTGCGRYLTD